MVESISVKDLHPKWEASCTIIDVRSPEEYAKGHVPQASLIPLNALVARAGEVPKQGNVYLICHSGGRSAQAAMFLAKEHGHHNLVNVSGGTMAWMQAGYPVEQGGV